MLQELHRAGADSPPDAIKWTCAAIGRIGAIFGAGAAAVKQQVPVAGLRQGCTKNPEAFRFVMHPVLASCCLSPRLPRAALRSLRVYLYKTLKNMKLCGILTAFGIFFSTYNLFAAPISFDEWFLDATLRTDYTFTGTAKTQIIALDELRKCDGWYGRRVNLDAVPLRGNGQLTMTDSETGTVIYRTSFSTLFQEWQTSEEATKVQRCFENVFQLPMPSRDVDVKVELYNTHDEVVGRYQHHVKVDDILIRPLNTTTVADHRELWKGGDSRDAIDVAILAEGYTCDEAETFYRDAQEACDELLRYEPFASYRNRFNIVAVALESLESGVSIPHAGVWKKTALSSSFDTFYSNRYLTTLRLKQMNDAIAGIPYEHIIILANTDNYGGGGIYNSYTLTAAHHRLFKPVTVHEFGHSFAALADEYFYDDQYEEFYHPGIEPWEQNITTLADFGAKWADMLPEGTPVPTPSKDLAPTDMQHIGVYEGGGYQSKGVYRPYMDCRMRTNEVPEYCKVCERAITRVIRFYTENMSE